MNGSTARSILVLNVGSSTLKFGVFPLASGDDAFLQGVLDHAGSSAGSLRITNRSGGVEATQLPVDSESAVVELLHFLERHPLLQSVEAVGHRLVHGGSTMREPVRIDARVRERLNDLIQLAPDHLPAELHVIDEVARRHPSLPQVGCFDTAFHASLPRVARTYGIPRPLTDSGVVRYGFHGLSFEYVTTTLGARGELPPRTIIAHLGNGASICAVRDGVSIDTSMGMTPTGGLVMSTRSGDLDPGVLLYLMRSRGFSEQQLEDATDRSGGLLGISGLTGDVRELLAASATNDRAAEAIDVFCYRARKFIGAYAAALGGIDLLVFTGGIGEHSAVIRESICGDLGFLGVKLDESLNRADASLVSATASGVPVRIIHTREDVMIATHVRTLLAKGLAN